MEVISEVGVQQQTDFVLVTDADNIIRVVQFIRNLEEAGLHFQLSVGNTVPVLFMKVHIPRKTLDHFVKVYDLDLEHRNHFILFRRHWFHPTSTPISRTDVFKKEGVATSAEKIYIIHKLMESTKFGPDEDMYGLSKLLRLKILLAAYPMHDGPSGWRNTTKPLNDRQMLSKYWANMSVWYKEQPLDLIEKYYGTEVAFYFAWTEFFNKLLWPAAIVGFLCFIISLIMFAAGTWPIIEEVCHSKMILCPNCQRTEYCVFQTLSKSCIYARWNYIFDNYLSVFFAVFMTFWARLFVIFWLRQEHILKLRWNVEHEDIDTDLRLQFKEKIKERKRSPITGEMEPHLSKRRRFGYLTLTVAACLFLILIVFLAILCVIYYKIVVIRFMHRRGSVFIQKNSKLFANVVGCALQTIFIKIFGKFYGLWAIWLTNLETPRTQSEYDNSVMYKIYILAFVNNYAVLFYIAFVKGRFFTSPDKQNSSNPFEQDVCAINCIVELHMQVLSLMLFKKLLGNLLTFLWPIVKKICRKTYGKESKQMPQWEKDYKLSVVNRYHVTAEMTEMVIEFGFVTFFAAAFPLAALCALFNNIFEIRLDAHKLTDTMHRPVPRKVSGIGSWNGILLAMTYLSTVINAFIIAFTSDFVSREIYRYRHDNSLKGFVSSTLSSFRTTDYSLYEKIHAPDVCYYKGKRYSFEHADKYVTTAAYWEDLAWRFVFVFVFEHLLLVLTGLLACLIPDVPMTVKTQMNVDRQLANESKLKAMAGEISNRSMKNEQIRSEIDSILQHRSGKKVEGNQTKMEDEQTQFDTAIETNQTKTEKSQTKTEATQTHFRANQTQPEFIEMKNEANQTEAYRTRSKVIEMRTEANQTEAYQTRPEVIEMRTEANQTEAFQTRPEVIKMRTEANQTEAYQTRPKVIEMRTEAIQTQPEAVKMRTEANQTQPEAVKMRTEANQTQPEAVKMRTEANQAQPEAVKMRTEAKAHQTTDGFVHIGHILH